MCHVWDSLEVIIFSNISLNVWKKAQFIFFLSTLLGYIFRTIFLNSKMTRDSTWCWQIASVKLWRLLFRMKKLYNIPFVGNFPPLSAMPPCLWTRQRRQKKNLLPKQKKKALPCQSKWRSMVLHLSGTTQGAPNRLYFLDVCGVLHSSLNKMKH